MKNARFLVGCGCYGCGPWCCSCCSLSVSLLSSEKQGEAGRREREAGGERRELEGSWVRIRSAAPEERPVHIEVAKRIPVRVARITVAAYAESAAEGAGTERRHHGASFLLRMRVHYVCRGVVGRRWAHTHVRLVSPAPAPPAPPASSPAFPCRRKCAWPTKKSRYMYSLCRSSVAAAAAVLAIVCLVVCVCVHGGEVQVGCEWGATRLLRPTLLVNGKGKGD